MNASNSKLDVVILLKTSKKPLAIEYTIPSVLAKLPHRDVYVVTKKDNFSALKAAFNDRIKLIDEDRVCDGLSIAEIEKYFQQKNEDAKRAGWYFQQFVKLGMATLSFVSDPYLVWDADTVVLRPISFFSKDGKVHISKYRHHHKPYFTLIKKLFGIEKQVNYSFIGEHLVFNKKIVLSILEEISKKKDGHWWFTILDNVDDLPGSGFSEYELYGNYVMKYYPNHFQVRHLYSFRGGTRALGMKPDPSHLVLLSYTLDHVSFEDHSFTKTHGSDYIAPPPARWLSILTLYLVIARERLRRFFNRIRGAA